MRRTARSVLAGTDLLVGVARHEGLAFLRHSDVDDDSDDDSAGRDRWRKALRTFVQVYTWWHTIASFDRKKIFLY